MIKAGVMSCDPSTAYDVKSVHGWSELDEERDSYPGMVTHTHMDNVHHCDQQRIPTNLISCNSTDVGYQKN